MTDERTRVAMFMEQAKARAKNYRAQIREAETVGDYAYADELNQALTNTLGHIERWRDRLNAL